MVMKKGISQGGMSGLYTMGYFKGGMCKRECPNGCPKGYVQGGMCKGVNPSEFIQGGMSKGVLTKRVCPTGYVQGSISGIMSN